MASRVAKLEEIDDMYFNDEDLMDELDELNEEDIDIQDEDDKLSRANKKIAVVPSDQDLKRHPPPDFGDEKPSRMRKFADANNLGVNSQLQDSMTSEQKRVNRQFKE